MDTGSWRCIFGQPRQSAMPNPGLKPAGARSMQLKIQQGVSENQGGRVHHSRIRVYEDILSNEASAVENPIQGAFGDEASS